MKRPARRLLLVVAAMSASPVLAKPPTSPVNAGDKGAAFEKRSEVPAEHSYQQAGKRDPFADGVEVTLPPPPPSCGRLCHYGIEELKLAALVTGISSPLAGVEAPNGKVYIVEKGTLIGKRGGRVVEISQEKVVVEEPCGKELARKCRTEIKGGPVIHVDDENLMRNR